MAKTTIDYLLNRSLKQLEGVHEYIKEKALALVSTAHCEGINIAITSGYRSNEEQAAIYGKGRSSYIYNGKQYGNPKEKKVSNAKPGTSYHNFGLAFDFTVFDDNRQPIWNGNSYDKVGKMGQALGLEWGGAWTGFKDRPHFQHTFGLSLAQLRSGTKPPTSVTVSKSPSKPVSMAYSSTKPIVPYPGLLKLGSKGTDVKRVQRAVGMPESLVDGVYGPRTKSYVEAYQTRKKLAVDGLVGPKTWNMMF